MHGNSTYLGQIVLVGTVMALEKKSAVQTKTDVQSKAWEMEMRSKMAILEGQKQNTIIWLTQTFIVLLCTIVCS